MVELCAEEYAQIIRSANFAQQVKPLSNTIEDMLARLDEFETLLNNVKVESSEIIDFHIKNINQHNTNLVELCERIDRLEEFVDVVSNDVEEMEKALDIADNDFDVTDYSFKGLVIKPLLSKAKSMDPADVGRSNLENGQYKRIATFKMEDFFAKSDE